MQKLQTKIKNQTNFSKPIVHVDNLKKYFEDIKAVDGISFEIQKGEIFGLLGPNGAGKSTILKVILGLLEPTNGTISVFGLNPEENEIQVKNRVGYVSEDPLIYKSLTPNELFNFILSIRKLKGSKITKKLQEYFIGLNALEYNDRLISTLSRGNKQKIQIIAALLHDPELLIMDEPLAGLDAKSVKVIKEIMDLHTERGGSILFSTHIMEIAEEVCDRIGIINKGKLVAIGTMTELRKAASMIDAEFDLEEIFLKLTDEDESVNEIVHNFSKLMDNDET